MNTTKVAKRIKESIINVIKEENAEEKITAENLDEILSAVASGCISFMGAAFLAAGFDNPTGPVAELLRNAADQIEEKGGKK